MKRKVLIDTDPGIDDAIAILMALASDRLDVKAITTVAGNVGIANVTRNALALVELGGKRLPVARGAVGPIAGKPIAASMVHGSDGLGGVRLPEPSSSPDPRPAIDLIRDTARECSSEGSALGGAINNDSGNAEGGLDIVAIGPLTNLAMAFAAYPELARGPDHGGIGRIYMMGGAMGPGNRTPYAEFNILADPRAAEAVFRSGVPITMCGLDVTRLAIIDEDCIARLMQGGRVPRLAAQMLEAYLDAYRVMGRRQLLLHDAVAVASAIDPAIVETRVCRIDVETEDPVLLGKTNVTFAPCSQPGHEGGLQRSREWNVELGLGLDHEVFIGLLLRLISSYK